MEDANIKTRPIDVLIRIGLISLLVFGSFVILSPFIIPLVWGIIIAVALWPVFVHLVKLIGGKKILVASFITSLALLILVIPSVWLMGSSAMGYQYLTEAFQAGNLTIPAPTDEVKTWPLIGDQLYSIWDLASNNLKEFINQYSEQLKNIGGWIFDAIAGLGFTLIQFIISIIISGVLLAKADIGQNTTIKFASKVVGKNAESFIKLTTGTIRSVVQGVLGIAAIQAIASAILLGVSGIPFSGLWAIFVLILAIMQLPPFLILGPIVIYVFTIMDTTQAVIFTIFAVIISVSDSLLKPVFLGRGVDVPMLVILLGAIGGMFAAGIIGLFIGAVVLALSYKLMLAWLNSEELS